MPPWGFEDKKNDFELLITSFYTYLLLAKNPYCNRFIPSMRFFNLKSKLTLRCKYNQVCEGIHHTILCNIEYFKALAIIFTHDCMFCIFQRILYISYFWALGTIPHIWGIVKSTTCWLKQLQSICKVLTRF